MRTVRYEMIDSAPPSITRDVESDLRTVSAGGFRS
jgi:hypothetical protein